MLKLIIEILIIILSKVILIDYGICQQNLDHNVNTNLAIQPIVKFCNEEPTKLWLFEDVIQDIYYISETPLTICFETNSKSSVFYLEADSKSGNLYKGKLELETWYLLCDYSEQMPSSSDPRWKPGKNLKDFLKNINSTGKHQWKLFARVFADLNSSYGVYNDRIDVIVLDNLGNKYTQKVFIRAKINKKSPPN